MLESPDELTFHSRTLENVVLKIINVTANQIQFAYSTPHENRPNSYQNRVCIWQSDQHVPFDTPALHERTIDLDTPSGDQSFEELDIDNNDYIIGYSVGPTDQSCSWSSYRNVVSSAYVPAKSGSAADPQYVYEVADCSIKYVGTNSVVANYRFLEGFNPDGAGSWGGIWLGESVSHSTPPLGHTKIMSSSSKGTFSLNGIRVTRDTTYTVGLFASGFPEDAGRLNTRPLACSITFTNN